MKKSKKLEEIKKINEYIKIIEENNQVLIFKQGIVHKLGNCVIDSINKRGNTEDDQNELESIIRKPIEVMLNLIKNEDIQSGIKNDSIVLLGKITHKLINSRIELFYKEIIDKLAKYLSIKSLEKTERVQIARSLNEISVANHRPYWLCETLQNLTEKEEDLKVKKLLKAAKNRCLKIHPT